jgi:ABC-type branched-subunit amino acid transport system ATPase component
MAATRQHAGACVSAMTDSLGTARLSAVPLLETRQLTRRFGGFVAVDAVDFRLMPGARQAIIGPNGAGKTTFINLLTGVLAPSNGRVLLDGNDITLLGQAQRVKRGLARTFQINRLFRGLSVLENVMIAVSERMDVAARMIRPAGKRREVLDEAMSLIEVLRLSGDSERRISELPYGRQRLVEIAIALGLNPRVLLLDEPMAGIPSAEGHIILDAIDRLPRDIGVLIVEHDMDVVFRFASRISVLVRGAVFAEGTPTEIKTNPEIRAVYLGQDGAHA